MALIPYQCPVCGGNGLRPPGFYTSIAAGISTSNGTANETCRTCGGTGMVWGTTDGQQEVKP